MVNHIEKLANTFFEEKKYLDAEELLKKIVANNPKDYEAIYKLAFICVAKNDLENANSLLSASIKTGGGLKTLELLAYVKEQCFEYFDAIVMYEQILELEPKEEIFIKVENLYINVELYDNAISTAVEHTQKFPTIYAYRRLFLLYLNLAKHNELKELCDEIDSKFKNQGIAINLIGMYKEHIEKDFDEARRLYEKASKLGSVTATYDLALCLKRLKMYDEAEKWLKKSFSTFPNKDDVYKSLSEIYFIQKKMRKGYKYYLERPELEDTKKLKNKWNGKPFVKETVLVYSDIPDSEIIRNYRYLSYLKDKFKKVVFAVSEKIFPFFEYNKIKCVKRNDIAEVNYDKYVLLSELQYYLNLNFENIPKVKLKAEKKELEGNFKVGLLWCATGDSLDTITNQSVDISKYFSEILEDKKIDFYSFQKNDIFDVLKKYDNVHDLSENLENYKNYAEYINSMDIIITIDSPILHLAGILNKPTLAILPHDSAWYWFDNDKKTEWYASVELFKQKIDEDWTNVSKQIIEKIKNGKYKKVK